MPTLPKLPGGCRRLTRDLDATTAVVLVLACGIGLSVAMFAVADTVVGAEYFETMGISLLSGRTFDRNDRSGSAPVAMVSEQAARLLGIENEAVGRRIRFPGSPGDWRTIVGVAADTRYRAIREAAPTVYLPPRAVH